MKLAVILCPASYPEVVRHAVQAACEHFDGATVSNADGSWIDPNGLLIHEPIRKIEIACEDTLRDRALLRSIAETIGKEAQQQCIYVQWPNGEIQLILTHHLWS